MLFYKFFYNTMDSWLCLPPIISNNEHMPIAKLSLNTFVHTKVFIVLMCLDL